MEFNQTPMINFSSKPVEGEGQQQNGPNTFSKIYLRLSNAHIDQDLFPHHMISCDKWRHEQITKKYENYITHSLKMCVQVSSHSIGL